MAKLSFTFILIASPFCFLSLLFIIIFNFLFTLIVFYVLVSPSNSQFYADLLFHVEHIKICLNLTVNTNIALLVGGDKFNILFDL